LVDPKEFDKLLADSIDDALLSLGESVREAIYFQIENKFSLPRSEIPRKLERFQSALERIFGVGSRFIEISIMKNLHSKTNHCFKIDDDQIEFVHYVKAARRSLTEKSQKLKPALS